MKNSLQIRYPGLPEDRLLRIFVFTFILLFTYIPGYSQKSAFITGDSLPGDTIKVSKDKGFRPQTRMRRNRQDTVFFVHPGPLQDADLKAEERSQVFYDSIYQKFSRKRFYQLMYGLAFRPPEKKPAGEPHIRIKSESPFEPYRGKVIRNIRVVTLDPFGTSTMDTLEDARTGVGRALNDAHLKTKSHVIRKNLFIREGQRVDPFLLADNERNLRGMSYVDNVRTLVMPVSPGSDSVDITIVEKDVWSIGFDVISASTRRAELRLYDGNFLGLGDRLSTSFSLKPSRSPFFLFDGASYTYQNIAGSFVNAAVNYMADDLGNETVNVSFNRDFYTITTRWAGGAGFQYGRMSGTSDTGSNEIISTTRDSYYHDVGLWAGHAVNFKHSRIPSRFVILESFFQRTFTSRPPVTINCNKSYYNITRLFTGIAWSANATYLTDYVLQLGKTENIPYGHLVEFTAGPEISDYYTRIYGGIELSAGDFLNGFGYLSGSIKSGGYLNHSSFEDGVLKLNMNYMTPLFMTASHKFKFRGYFFSDFRYGFNSRTNNTDYTDVNNDLEIRSVKNDSLFYGKKSLAATLSVVMNPRFYFYGFKFAFSLQVRGGFIAPGKENLVYQPFYTGIGIGTVIRNDNLIFPLLQISCFYYPAVPNGVPWLQFQFREDANLTFPDFSVTAPHAETLQN
jgi:hypothetical protein